MLSINTYPIDRMLRALVGVLAVQIGYFWLDGVGQLLLYALGAVALLTALTGFCPAYRLLGRGAAAARAGWPRLAILLVFGALLIGVLAGGSYASTFFSRKFFLEDFNAMNQSYKQTLYLTGQNQREQAIANYDQLVAAYDAFSAKYASYRPYALRDDPQFGGDLTRVAGIIAGVSDQVRAGDLHEAHLALEGVRPIFQEMFKRNGFSMLAITLVDFHDAMETILDPATQKDAAGVLARYPEVSAKLAAVEAEANDAEIAAIRANLDTLNDLAARGAVEQLPAQANTLKSSFVKVYLVRG